MHGAFVTFEGGDGSGKSTQIVRLAQRLRAAGRVVLTVREPGGTPFAEAARDLLLDGIRHPGATTEAFLIEAARADLVAEVIRPALARGEIVLGDRHVDSTLAYQGFGRGLDLDTLRGWNLAATGALRPVLTLLFDLDATTGLARRAAAAGAPNRLDREPIEFHQKVRAGFLELARNEPDRFVVIDATQPPDRLEAQVWDAVSTRLSS